MAELTEHHFKCEACGAMYDRRDFGEMIHHNTAKCLTNEPMADIPYNTSRRKGDDIEWTKDKKPINLN